MKRDAFRLLLRTLRLHALPESNFIAEAAKGVIPTLLAVLAPLLRRAVRAG